MRARPTIPEGSHERINLEEPARALLACIGATPLVALALPGADRATVLAKVEFQNPGGSLKDRPVRAMVLDALRRGELEGGRRLLDSSSGNAGIAYAMIGAALGIPVTLVVPGNASLERKQRIRAHGAELIETDPLEGYDAAIHHAHELARRETDRYLLANQYANQANWRAHYETTGPEIWEQTAGRVTHFVAGVGTGGTGRKSVVEGKSGE